GNGRRRCGVLPAVLRGAQGQVRARVPRVRVPPRRQAPVRQQLQLQEDTMIRKEVFVSPSAAREARRIIQESEVMKEDDSNWPEPNHIGRQELEIVMGNEHISFTTSKIGSLVDVQASSDPGGLRIFYYLVQDLKCFVFSLINLHYKIKPIQS
ncbi:hypothetical protein PVAP13_2NG394500, partial [Panicum virgatum]